MTIKAYCGFRRGGSGCRTIKDATEAEKILKGGYGVTTVSLENDQGDVVGKRWRHYEFGKAEWMWFYEPDAFQ
jgi:hypothetical protein